MVDSCWLCRKEVCFQCRKLLFCAKESDLLEFPIKVCSVCRQAKGQFAIRIEQLMFDANRDLRQLVGRMEAGVRIVNDAELDRHRKPGRCEWCGQWFALREPHHLTACGTGGHKRLDIPINLLALGSTHLLHPCHTFLQRADEGLRLSQLHIVAKRERTTTDDIEAVRWAILRIPKEGRPAQIEAEAASLTLAQQELYWCQLSGTAAKRDSQDELPF